MIKDGYFIDQPAKASIGSVIDAPIADLRVKGGVVLNVPIDSHSRRGPVGNPVFENDHLPIRIPPCRCQEHPAVDWQIVRASYVSASVVIKIEVEDSFTGTACFALSG